ncbi:MAG TPA: 50S ribosomal protein L25 [Acidimicrobiales bacterium]|nr:50S ribosomal protein L25 [Acidimicrobiales bacterium]
MPAEITLSAELGRPIGSRDSRRLRHSGRVPAVVYGHGMKPLSISVGARDLRSALSAHGVNQVLTLQLDGATHLVLARQLQRHPVKRTVAHVDFQVVRRDEIVSAEVSIVLVGTATRVEQERGVLEHALTSLPIRTTPDQIPEQVEVDVSDLEIGGSIRVRDLQLPAGVRTDADPDEAVVVAAAARVEVEEAAEAPEGEAGEAAGEGGEAASTGGAEAEG